MVNVEVHNIIKSLHNFCFFVKANKITESSNSEVQVFLMKFVSKEAQNSKSLPPF